MKIVISSDIYYPMINGVAVFSRNLATGMAQRGHEVIVLAPSISGEFEIEKDRQGKFKVVRLPSFKIPFYPDQINEIKEVKKFFGRHLPQLFYRNGLHVSLNPYPEIKKVLNSFQPDIIHNQSPGPVALAVYRYAKKFNVPLVATGHAYPDNFTSQLHIGALAKKPLDVVMKNYFASFLRKSAYATVPTEIAMDDLLPKRRRRFKTPVEAISNGVDLSMFSYRAKDPKICKKYKIDPNKKTVLYVGRIDPEKSLHVLMEAYARVSEKTQNTQLVLVGDGTDKNRLKMAAEEMHIQDRVIFTGRVVGKNLPKLYNVGDVFAISSTTETQSIVVMEAMASGLPIVAVRAGALEELVHNKKNGFIYNAGDVGGIAKGLKSILEHPDMQKRMSKESLQMAKKHDICYTLSRMEEIYRAVIKSHSENF